MAKEVSLGDLAKWIMKNEHRTWSRFETVDYEKRTLEIKYLRFNLDTRDMRIFAVSVDGGAIKADFREPYEGTVLDLLEHKLDERKP